jgi:hypothetical protein
MTQTTNGDRETGHGHDAAAIGALLRRRGLPERPVVGVPVTEIRSDGFLGSVPTLDAGAHGVALAGLILEWEFSLPYHMLPEVLQFLTDNDVFIADSCKKMMTGVTYYGTYVGAVGQRAKFRTIWGYASWDAHNEWSKVVATAGTANSRLYDLMSALRTYWLMDPDGSQEHMAYAANVDIAAHPFLGLTVAADMKKAGK